MNDNYKKTDIQEDIQEVNKKFEIARSKLEMIKSGSNVSLDDVDKLILDFRILKIDYHVLEVEFDKKNITENQLGINGFKTIKNIINYLGENLNYLEQLKNKLFLKRKMEHWKNDYDRACSNFELLKSKSDKTTEEISSLIDIFSRLHNNLLKIGNHAFRSTFSVELQQKINYLKGEQNKLVASDDDNLLLIWYNKFKNIYGEYRILMAKDMKEYNEVVFVLNQLQNVRMELGDLRELVEEEWFNECDSCLSAYINKLVGLRQLLEDNYGQSSFHR